MIRVDRDQWVDLAGVLAARCMADRIAARSTTAAHRESPA